MLTTSCKSKSLLCCVLVRVKHNMMSIRPLTASSLGRRLTQAVVVAAVLAFGVVVCRGRSVIANQRTLRAARWQNGERETCQSLSPFQRYRTSSSASLQPAFVHPQQSVLRPQPSSATSRVPTSQKDVQIPSHARLWHSGIHQHHSFRRSKLLLVSSPQSTPVPSSRPLISWDARWMPSGTIPKGSMEMQRGTMGSRARYAVVRDGLYRVASRLFASSSSSSQGEPLSSASSSSTSTMTKTTTTTSERQQLQQQQLMRSQRGQQLRTLLRVTLPSIATGVVAYLAFPGLALTLASSWRDPGVFAVLSQDSSQFVQNFLTVVSLLFSILVGQTYYFLYTQQESIYYSLFAEVTEAKSLLEQVALVCQGRSMYPRCLQSIARYVQDDLKQIQCDPALLLSARPVDDPLESIMYMTSVGVPSTVYETVKSLREARARRLGALQRKLPSIHMLLLWILAAIELVSFPLLGAGTQTLGGYHLLTVEGVLFGVMTGGLVLTLRIVGELWRPAGGAYNVDAVLSVMVRGLEEELRARMTASASAAASVAAVGQGNKSGASMLTSNSISGSSISSTMAPSGAREFTDIQATTTFKQSLDESGPP